MLQNLLRFLYKVKKFRRMTGSTRALWLVLTILSVFQVLHATLSSDINFSLPSQSHSNLKIDDPFEHAFDDYDKADGRTFDSFGGSGGSNSFVKQRLYNTSIALTASMFTYYLPSQTEPGTITNLVNQAVYGLFGTLAVCLIFAVPVLLTGVMYSPDASRSINGESGNDWITSPIMRIENVRQIFNEEFRDDIGLDYEKCLMKTICEAHRSPKNKKYGLLALPFQMFFPPYKKDSFTSRATSYQLAAAEGSYNTKSNCAKKYKCFFDTLDLATFLIDWYRLQNDPDYVPEESDFD